MNIDRTFLNEDILWVMDMLSQSWWSFHKCILTSSYQSICCKYIQSVVYMNSTSIKLLTGHICRITHIQNKSNCVVAPENVLKMLLWEANASKWCSWSHRVHWAISTTYMVMSMPLVWHLLGHPQLEPEERVRLEAIQTRDTTLSLNIITSGKNLKNRNKIIWQKRQRSGFQIIERKTC